MIFVGLLENDERNLPYLTTRDYFSETVKREEAFEKRIVEYLKSGVFVAGIMNYTRNVFTGESIDALTYYTDNVYIWPVYFPYYIEKYPGKVFISPDFIEHLKNMDFKIPAIDKEREREVTRYFDQKWQGK